MNETQEKYKFIDLLKLFKHIPVYRPTISANETIQQMMSIKLFLITLTSIKVI